MSTIENGPGNENPSEKGAEEETQDAPASLDGAVSTRRSEDLRPIPRPGAPMVPDHPNIDANPIDPRVF